ncbi:MAG: GTPase [Caldisericia bacterium]
MPEDTIVAPASAPVPQAVGIVRISGSKSFDFVKNIIIPEKLPEPGSFSYRKILDYETKEILDTGIVLVFKNPYSFTGEDSVEIQVHGSPIVLNRITELLVKNGARRADPGEFSLRAFINGKATISELELGNVITNAKSFSETKGITKSIGKIRESLTKLVTELEAAISYPNYTDFNETGFNEKLSNLVKMVKSLLESSAIPGLPQVVLAGPPNAGKSTLFNHLLGFERTVVSDKAGTTRDYVKAVVIINGREVEIIDGPGLDIDNPDSGQDLVKTLISTSDLVLWMDPDENPVNINNNHLLIKSKSETQTKTANSWIEVSIKEAIGVEKLKSVLIEALPKHEFITTKRQHNILLSLMDTIRRANDSSEFDIKAFELNSALKLVSELDGINCPTETLKNIFGSFCIGK